MADVQQTLTIEVKYKDNDAGKQIRALRGDVESLNSALSGSGFNKLNGIASNFKALGGSVPNLSNLGNSLKIIDSALHNLSASAKSFNAKSFASKLSSMSSSLESAGKAFGSLGKLSSSLQKLSKVAGDPNLAKNFSILSNEIIKFAQNISNGMSDATLSRLERLGTAMSQMSSANGKTVGIGSMSGSANSATVSFGKLADKLKTVISLCFKLGSVPFKMILSPLQGIGRGLMGMTQKFTSFLSGIGRIALYRAIRTGIKLVTQSIREGVNNLYLWSEQVGNSFEQTMDSLATSFLYLKNSIGAAVSPLLDALAPALETIVNQIVDVLNIFNQVLAVMTGADTWRRAIRTAADYSDNISGIGHDAQDANDAVKELKRTILGFDEINKLEDKTKTLSPKQSGKDATGYYAKQGAFSFEEVPITNTAKNIADKLKKAFETGNFTAVGNAIAKKIADALDGIEWENKVRPAVSKIATSLGTLLNGLLDYNGEGGKKLWDAVAKTIYEGINTAILGYVTFFQTVHWEGIGEGIGAAVAKVCKNIKWVGDEKGPGLDDALSAFPNAVISALTGFTKRFTINDFAELGTNIGKTVTSAISKIKWSELFNSGINIFTGLLTAVTNAIKALEWSKIKSAIMTGVWSVPSSTWETLGKNIANTIIGVVQFGVNLLDTVTEFLAKGIDWKKIKDGIVNGIKAVPNSTWKEMGTNIGNSIFNILSFTGSILLTFLEALQSVKWDQLVNGIKTGISKKVEEAGGWGKIASDIGKHIMDNLGAIEILLTFTIGIGLLKGLAASFASTLIGKIGGLVVPGMLGKGMTLSAWAKAIPFAGGVLMAIDTINAVRGENLDEKNIKTKFENTMAIALRGAFSGGLFGFGVGNFLGGAYGMIIGAGIALDLKALNTLADHLKSGDMPSFVKELSGGIIGSALGLALGLTLGPVGGVAGAVLGFGIGVELTLWIERLWPKLKEGAVQLAKETWEGSMLQGIYNEIFGTAYTGASESSFSDERAQAAVKSANNLSVDDIDALYGTGNTPRASVVTQDSDRVGAADTRSGRSIKLTIHPVLDSKSAGDAWKQLCSDWEGFAKIKKVAAFLTEGIVDKSTDWWTSVKTYWSTVIRGKTAVPFTIQGIVDKASDWWGQVTGYWKTYIVDKEAAQFNIQGIVDKASVWWGQATTYWKEFIADKKASEFTIEGVKDQALTWWGQLTGWWDDIVKDNKAGNFSVGVEDESWDWWDFVTDAWDKITRGSALDAEVKIGNPWDAFADAFNAMQKYFNNNPLTAIVKTVTNAVSTATSASKSYQKSSNGAWNLPTPKAAKGGVYKNGQWHDVTAFASGGVPMSGEMFIAREAGPELVGTIGGNTAVMNNDQIVSSVAAGVAQAVASVMNGGGMNSPIEVTVKVDSETLYRTVRKGERKASGRYGTAIALG